jgi:two-component system, sensor histidine kinase PdtaS
MLIIPLPSPPMTKVLFSLFLVISVAGKATGLPDTLTNRLSKIKDDSIRVALLVQVSLKAEKAQPDSARKYARMAMKEALSPSAQSSALINYAKILDRSGDSDSALIVLDALILKMGKMFKHGLQGNAFEAMADINYRKGEIVQALNIIGNAVKAYQIEGDRKQEAAALNSKGLYYKYLASYDKALEQYFKALQIYDEIGEDGAKASVYTNLGVIYKNREEYEKATDFHKQALELHRKAGNTSGMGDCYNNLGIVLKNQERFDEALMYYNKALLIWREVGNQRKESYTLNNMAVVYIDTDRLGLAMEALRDSEKLKLLTNDVVTMCGVKVNMALVFIKEKRYQEAEQSLMEALRISIKTGTRESRLAVYRELSGLYEARSDFKQAYTYQIHYNELNDSLYGLEKIQLMNELELRYLEEKIQREEESRKQLKLAEDALILAEKEKQEEKLRLSRNLTLALAAISVLSLLLFISVFRRYRLSKRSRAELEEKNRQLLETTLSKEEKELLLSEIHHRVKNNMQIISSMLRLQASQIPDDRIQAMFQEAQHRINSMSLVHEELYKTRDFSGLDMQPYLRNLAEQIIRSFSGDKQVDLQYAVASEFLVIDKVIPLGLIVTEILTNSMKHAFNLHSSPVIYIKGYQADGNIVLQVGDNGSGAELVDSKESTLGLELIETLCEQLDAQLRKTINLGYHYEIRFPVDSRR